MASIFIHTLADEETYGPYRLSELKALLEEGSVLDSDYLCTDGENWHLIGDWMERQQNLKLNKEKSSKNKNKKPASKSKVVTTEKNDSGRSFFSWGFVASIFLIFILIISGGYFVLKFLDSSETERDLLSVSEKDFESNETLNEQSVLTDVTEQTDNLTIKTNSEGFTKSDKNAFSNPTTPSFDPETISALTELVKPVVDKANPLNQLLPESKIVKPSLKSNRSKLELDSKFQSVFVKEGTLYFEDGEEVKLWGVNFQSAMSWEFNRYRRLARDFSKFNLEDWKVITDRGFDEIQQMGCDVIRIHLGPGDFTDENGNLVENEWLDMVDYTMAECVKRGIYINFALLNHLGNHVKNSFFNSRLKEHKWELMTVPRFLKASENYIKQFVNRKNPYDQNRLYKNNPAWIVAELINEPGWPKEIPREREFPEGYEALKKWCSSRNKEVNNRNYSTYKYESIKKYINLIKDLLDREKVPAITCWNLYWSQGPKHQGPEAFRAAADSEVDMVSFSTYPGQNDSDEDHLNDKEHGLEKKNYLPYLKKSYKLPDYQSWLTEDRFKGRKSSIVYEFETWHNQTTYLYPAMAKYFRAQGAQIATMWTYNMGNIGQFMSKNVSHNLNLMTTPRKAASFLVAREIFYETPRYINYQTTTDFSDRSKNAHFSFTEDLSAYSSEEIFIHTGDVSSEFLGEQKSVLKIIGYGDSPFIKYQGKGLYFIEKKIEERTGRVSWLLELKPHAEFTPGIFKFDKRKRSPAVLVDKERLMPITIQLPGLKNTMEVYRLDGGDPLEVATQDGTFQAKPGRYLIQSI